VQVGTALLVALLAAPYVRGTSVVQPRRAVRLYNASVNEQTVAIQGIARTLAPSSTLDLDVEACELSALELPAGIVAVERVPLDDRETDELQILRAIAAATCAPTIPVRVPLMSCRFGTAEAQVQSVAGAKYQWTVEGGAILSGDGTPSILIGFGGATSALARLTMTLDGCVSTGAAVLSLRDPLTATVTVADGNVGTPARVTWSYNTTEPILTQILQVPDQAAPIGLPPDARSYVFTPTTEGTKTVKLTAALYRLGARRRAASSGNGPRASSCIYVESQGQLRVRPPCSGPIARVSGGGIACGSTTIHARFDGTPPFKGRWSDGVQFETSAVDIDRTVTASGTYKIDDFEDATCVGTSTGSATAAIQDPTRALSLTMSPPQAVSLLTYDGRIAYAYSNATGCRLTSALDNGFYNYPSCTDTGSGITSYVPENRAGDETLTFQVSGPCGTDERSVHFFVCGYQALVTASGPTTFCAGGSVTLGVEIAGTTAGPPYREYRFYRCTAAAPGCQQASEYSLVQQGPSATFVATQAGVYRAATEDRLGCPSLEGGSVRVTVNPCAAIDRNPVPFDTETTITVTRTGGGTIEEISSVLHQNALNPQSDNGTTATYKYFAASQTGDESIVFGQRVNGQVVATSEPLNFKVQ